MYIFFIQWVKLYFVSLKVVLNFELFKQTFASQKSWISAYLISYFSLVWFLQSFNIRSGHFIIAVSYQYGLKTWVVSTLESMLGNLGNCYCLISVIPNYYKKYCNINICWIIHLYKLWPNQSFNSSMQMSADYSCKHDIVTVDVPLIWLNNFFYNLENIHTNSFFSKAYITHCMKYKIHNFIHIK